MQNSVQPVLQQVKKVIIGKDLIIEKVLMAILAKGHILLEDVPGVGKTTLALAFGKSLGLEYKRIQFTSDTMPSDVTGFSIFNKAKGVFEYQQGPIMTNILLADEINRTSSKTQGALLEAMEEKQVTVDGVTHTLPQPFFVLATQNPVGSAGTQLLPTSQLDRFMLRLKMGYPDFKEQVSILKQRHTENPLNKVETVLNTQKVLQLQKQVDNVYIDDSIYEYVTTLTEQTRNNLSVELGVSPRGALAVCNIAKAAAFLSDRDYVIPQDVDKVFCSTTAHRLVLSRKAKISNVSAEDVINEILENTDKPSVSVQGV